MPTIRADIYETLEDHLKWYFDDNDKFLVITRSELLGEVEEAVAFWQDKTNLEGVKIHPTFIPYWSTPSYSKEYTDHRIALCYDAPEINMEATFDLADALFPSDPKKRLACQLREGPKELYTAMHIIRPVYGDKYVAVVGPYWPIEFQKEPQFGGPIDDKRGWVSWMFGYPKT